MLTLETKADLQRPVGEAIEESITLTGLARACQGPAKIAARGMADQRQAYHGQRVVKSAALPRPA